MAILCRIVRGEPDCVSTMCHGIQWILMILRQIIHSFSGGSVGCLSFEWSNEGWCEPYASHTSFPARSSNLRKVFPGPSMSVFATARRVKYNYHTLMRDIRCESREKTYILFDPKLHGLELDHALRTSSNRGYTGAFRSYLWPGKIKSRVNNQSAAFGISQKMKSHIWYNDSHNWSFW